MNFATTLLKNSFTLFEGTKFQFNIYYYAICIVTGFAIAGALAVPMCKRRGFSPDILLDIMIAIIPCAIIFARVWYVILDLDEFESFKEMLDVRNGGLAIHGGVMGGALGLFIVSKVRKVSFFKLCDLGACVLPLGQAIGRWGNYFNQEVYGTVTDVTWAPYSVFIEKTGQYHLALCFYEMILDFLLFVLLYWFLFKYKGKRDLYATGTYFFAYGVIRACLEPLRAPEFQMGNNGELASVFTSVALIAGGLIILAVILYKDIKEKNYWWKDFFKKKEAVPQSEDKNGEV